jgi:hypothetical protein
MHLLSTIWDDYNTKWLIVHIKTKDTGKKTLKCKEESPGFWV